MSDPKVKRYTVSYRDGIKEYAGGIRSLMDSEPMVRASDYDQVVQERDQLRKQVLRIGNFDVYEFSSGLAIRDADGLVAAMHPMRWLELRKQVEEQKQWMRHKQTCVYYAAWDGTVPPCSCGLKQALEAIGPLPDEEA
jgi:hypothetical protein